MYGSVVPIHLWCTPPVKLSRIDLNLLVALDALLAEPTVTAAAKRLGLSQSATSHALGRLRELLGDPLLVRTSAGMTPTHRARKLAGPVRRILDQVREALDPPGPFDPLASGERFVLGAEEATVAGLVPLLMQRFASEAPGIDLRAEGRHLGLATEELAAGRVDLAITVFPQVPPRFHARPVLELRYETLARAGHPAIGRRLTVQRFASLGHVAIEGPGSIDVEIDRQLRERSLRRRVAVSVSSPLSIPWIVASSDLVATLPELLFATIGAAFPLTRRRTPLPLEPMPLVMVWHDRTHRDPAQLWFRGVVREVFGDLERAARSKR